jgi:cytochrome c oxidase subunit 1
LHDTYYVIGHFHYVVAPGILFGFFAGILHWYPKITGRYMSKTLNHLHFWPTLICMNIIFFPMLVQGMAGFHRRWYNGGDAYLEKAADGANVFGQTVLQNIDLNIPMSMGAWTMALFQVFFIINLFTSWKWGKKANSDNPWNATTLEWATPTPPGHGNFLKEPVTYRGPYEYSRPEFESDFVPQWIEPKHLVSEQTAVPNEKVSH